MAKTDLLKEAIADAKAVRETALANAKIALEEAFTPRIQSMLSAKLSEDEEMEAPVEEPAEEPAMDMGEDMAPEEEEMAETAEEPTETNGDGMDAAAGAPVEETEGDEMEEDLELEAILKELEEDEDKEGMDETEDKEEMDEVSDSTDIGKGDNKMDQADGSDQDDPGKGKLSEDEDKEEANEDVSLDEIIAALQEDEEKEEVSETEDKEETNEAEDKEKDLEEAYNVIRFLKSKINEVNLLNAKLLFSNKLFRNHSLNENQKMKVIENFDRAQSLREVKLVFATLSESFKINGGKTKRTIKESYASKPSRSTAPKKVISEGSALSARWKKLANL